MKKPSWQSFWWRLLFRADGERDWRVLGPGPLTRVPNGMLKDGSPDAWARSLLGGAPFELDDLRGDLLLECFTEPTPPDGTPPAYAARTRLPGHALPPYPRPLDDGEITVMEPNPSPVRLPALSPVAPAGRAGRKRRG